MNIQAFLCILRAYFFIFLNLENGRFQNHEPTKSGKFQIFFFFEPFPSCSVSFYNNLSCFPLISLSVKLWLIIYLTDHLQHAHRIYLKLKLSPFIVWFGYHQLAEPVIKSVDRPTWTKQRQMSTRLCSTNKKTVL